LRSRTRFASVAVIYLVYAAIFIWRTSFVVAGERYFSLFDDAMVSMRFARNLAAGYGLVWNPGGEAVEGYTNPLWVLFMAAIHLFPIAESKISLIIQIAAAIFLAVNLIYVRRIALAITGGLMPVALGAIVITASYLPINNWGLQGMEVSVLVLLTTACIAIAIESLVASELPHRLYGLLGVGTLIRPDMVVPYVGFLAFLAFADKVHRRRHLLWGLSVLIAAWGAQTIFRVWYFGDMLPNTFYLKVTGVSPIVRMSRGMYVLLQFIWKSNPLVFVLPAVLLFRRDLRVWLLFWILALQMAYSVYVGGDAWEYWGGSNRYICIAMPGFFVLLSWALYAVSVALMQVVRANAVPLAFTLAVAYAVLSLNSIHGLGAWEEATLIEPPLHTGPGGENQQDVEQALALREATTGKATLAVMRAGTIPYFADRYTFDLLGKSDKHVARVQPRTAAGATAFGFREFRPGHMKFDFPYSIGRGRPDVILHLQRRAEAAQPFLHDFYRRVFLGGKCVYARRESPNVFWERLPRNTCEE